MAKNTNMNAKKKKVSTGPKKPKAQFSKIKQNLSNKKENVIARVETEIKNKKKTKEEKPKKKRHILLIAFMTCLIVGALSCLAGCIYIILNAPEFDVELLFPQSMSVLHDMNGGVLAEIGAERRENVTYDELPEVLVDAIVATEDSKFFQHGGIDLLRFGKAAVGQLMGHDDAGGGSTLTMQISKNTYMGTESRGIKGIIRKFSDIYMAVFKIEKTYTKQEILEFYVNQGLLGMSNYGVSQASHAYFGKDVGELNLSEAALIAGLFQAPNSYYPFLYPEKAQNRRNMVLNLMVKHGYITEEESQAAKSIDVKDMLVAQEVTQNNKYPGVTDTIVAEVIKRTGKDPYLVSMNVYTTIDPSKQDVIEKLYDGTLYKWKNDVVQCGIAVTDVHTGAIVAIGAGRNRSGVKLYNYATDINRHPGSIAKPIFDYGPAVEYAGWGTGNTIVDDVYTYSNGQDINNVDKGYAGIMMVKTALSKSRNIPALQAFQATSQEDKYEFVMNLGMTPELHNGEILESSSIGAYNGANPLQMSAAYGAFARGGYYIEPYAVTRVEFNDTKEVYNHQPTRTKAMSEETAYIINMILKYAVTSGSVATGSISGTDVAGKTGTSSEDANRVKQLKLSSNTIKDSWEVVYTPDYSLAFWYGYDFNTKEYHLTSSEGWGARSAIAKALAPRIMKKNSRWTKPSGVITVDVELETMPTQLASDFTPKNMRSTEYYKKGTEPTEVSTRFSRLDDVSNLTYTTVGNQVQLSWSPIDLPDAIDANYLRNYFDTNYTRWADKYYNKRLEYNANNIGTVIYEVFLKNESGAMVSLGTTASTSFSTSVTNASSATFVVKSTYSTFRDNASAGREVTVRFSSPITPPTTGEDGEDDEDDDNNHLPN